MRGQMLGTDRIARGLLLVPSAYGLGTFSLAFALYKMNLTGYQRQLAETDLLVLAVCVVMLSATLAFIRPSLQFVDKPYVQVDLERGSQRWGGVILPLHILGAYGIWSYVSALVGLFGSWAAVGVAFLTESYQLRWASEDIRSVGTQLSYFGWLAIWLTVLRARRDRLSLLLWAFVAIQFALNLVYIDRTRPTWILLVAMLLMLKRHMHATSVRRLLGGIGGAFFVLFALFIGIGAWVGKIQVMEPGYNLWARIPELLKPAYMYSTSGFAYFDNLVGSEQQGEGVLTRTFYPLAMVAAKLGLSEAPPSQVLPFMSVPMPTNVGTFMEPFYRDVGVFGVLLGALAISFGGNALAIGFLRSRSEWGAIAWANIAFVSFIAFFVPKVSSVPAWLFVGIPALAMWVGKVRHRQRSKVISGTNSKGVAS
jgi:hypothetical protein